MSAIMNDGDLLLQATVPRFVAAADRALLLQSTANQFQVPASGIGSPASIDFTATLLNMTGSVSFAASGGSVLTRVGNVATMTYNGMVGSPVTITASIVVDGLTYTATATVSKSFDGVTGNSSRTCYSKTSLGTLSSTPASLTTAGSTTYPPADSWGTGTVWGGSTLSLAAGESLFQSDGIYNPASGTTTWTAPYLSSLRVGSLSALTIYTGGLTVSGTISDAGGNWSVNSSGQAVMKAVTILGADGNVLLSSGASGIDYSKVLNGPPANATVGASFGLNIGGQITKDNVSTYLAGAAIGIAYINTATIGSLSALSAELGSAVISTAGFLRSGQTAYAVGSGFWLGIDSDGVAKFSIGDANQYLHWDQNGLKIRINTFVARIAGTLLTTVANGSRNYGTLTASLTGSLDTGPYTYTWAISSVTSSNDTGDYAVRFTGGDTTTAAGVGGLATNNVLSATITLIVTDSQGRVSADSVHYTFQHGTPN